MTLPFTSSVAVPLRDGDETSPVGVDNRIADGAHAQGEGANGSSTHPAGLVIVGVDLALEKTGIATRHGADVITSTGRRSDTLTQRRYRLNRIRARVLDWCAGADLVVIEAPSYGSKGGSAHDRSGLWWLVVFALIHRDVAVVAVAPSTRAKYATGNGRADKDVVLAAAVRRLPIHVENNNTADAAWLCAIGHDLLEQPLCPMPATHRVALDTVRPHLTHHLTGTP